MGSPLVDVSVMRLLPGEKQPLQLLSPIESAPAGEPEPAAAAANGTGTCSAATLRSIYMSFLRDMHYDPAGTAPSSGYGDRMAAISVQVSALCGNNDDGAVVVPKYMVGCSARLAATAYSHLSLASQVKVAHYNALLMCVDDQHSSTTAAARARYLQDLALFSFKLTDPSGYATRCPGRGGLLDPRLKLMIAFLWSEQSPFYGTHPRRHAVLVRSTLDFVEANLVEAGRAAAAGDLDGPAGGDMRLAPVFWRWKSGAGEIFAHFVYMDCHNGGSQEEEEEERFYGTLYSVVPELAASIHGINDVLSLYKELQDGDTTSTVVMDARIHGVRLEVALAAHAQYPVGSRTRMLSVLTHVGAPHMRPTFDRFMQGYLVFHVADPRYRLHQILPPAWYDQARRLLLS